MADIITLAEYRAYADLPSPVTNETQIESAIELATARIENLTGRVFEIADDPSPHDEIEVLNGLGCGRIFTHNAPLTAVSKIEYWTGTDWEEYDTTAQPYTFKPNSNTVYFTGGHTFYKGYQNIRVTYEYGYDTEFPADLKLACAMLVEYLLIEFDRMGINSQADGEQSFSYDHAMLKTIPDIIARYKTVW